MAAVTAVAASMTSSAQAAGQYINPPDYVVHSVPTPGASQAYPSKINFAGDVSGTAVMGDLPIAFFWDSNNDTTYYLPSVEGVDYVLYSFAYGMNNDGEVVGTFVYFDEGNAGRGAFIWYTDTNTAYLLISDGNAYATGINDDGTVVGYDIDATPPQNGGIIWYDASMPPVSIGSLENSTYTFPNDINNFGSIAGSDVVNGTQWAFEGLPNDLNALPYLSAESQSEGRAINDSGWVVGGSTLDDLYQAGVWKLNGELLVIYPFDGDSVSFACGVNNHCQVVGWSGVDQGGVGNEGGIGEFQLDNGFVWFDTFQNSDDVTFPLSDPDLVGNYTGHITKGADVNDNGTIVVQVVNKVGDIDVYSVAVLVRTSQADLDHNGVVNGEDLGLLLSQWGSVGSSDLSLDGVVNSADLGILLGEWS